ncbi:[FeFe] hydrogenase H-cluster radical SAM maturase HydE [bacterium]|nr:[FeFe] hydrogenase H-cluster radical SAM maturase HydE [candidate division CSSED10-310 bacterium]
MKLQKNEIAAYLSGADDSGLYDKARFTCNAVFGSEIYLRGIIEFSNVCSKHCRYCGLRPENTAVQRYRLSESQIIHVAGLLPELGIGTVVLQSGDDPYYSKEMVGSIVREIKLRYDLAVTLSLGDRSRDEYAFWKDCGADRYLLKAEIFDTRMHALHRPGELISERCHRIYQLKALGYETGSGIIVGLPDSTIESLAEDLMQLTAMELHMIAAGPFIPHPNTPLCDAIPGNKDLSLRSLAVLRLMNPDANIPATSALGVNDPFGRIRGLEVGANVIMPSITPESVRKLYEIYPDKNVVKDDVTSVINHLKEDIKTAGYQPSSSKGFSPKYQIQLRSVLLDKTQT